MTKRTAKRLGVAGLLVVGAAVFATSLRRQFGSALGGNDAIGEAPVVDEPGQGEAPIGVDLLAAYGTYPVGQMVANPFVWVEVEAVPPAPGGEVGTPSTGTPFEPVPMTVSLVLLADPVARAVVDAQVVGLGDKVAAGVVRQVTAEGVEIEHGSRRLFYELRRPWPRGYEAPANGGNEDKDSDPSRKSAERGEDR